MTAIFENFSTATIPYHSDVNLSSVQHNGREYRAVGESCGKNSFGNRFKHILAVIGLVAAAILTLCIPFIFKGYRDQIHDQIQYGKENVTYIHYVPKERPTLSSWQKALIEKEAGICDRMKSDVVNHTCNFTLFSASCFINLTFAGGEIKKQFIFENESGDPLTTEVLVDQIDKINLPLTKILEEEVNLNSPYIHFEYIILYKPVDQEVIAARRTSQYDVSNNGNFGSAGDRLMPDTILKRSGFSESFFAEGKFIKSEFFQQLD